MKPQVDGRWGPLQVRSGACLKQCLRCLLRYSLFIGAKHAVLSIMADHHDWEAVLLANLPPTLEKIDPGRPHGGDTRGENDPPPCAGHGVSHIGRE